MEEIFEQDPAAIAVIESALIFEVVRDALARGEKEGVLADWRRRIDYVVLVTAPDDLKIARYVARINPSGPAREAAEVDARLRLAQQIPDAEKAALSDYVIDNSGDKAALYDQVADLWTSLKSPQQQFPRRVVSKIEDGGWPDPVEPPQPVAVSAFRKVFRSTNHEIAQDYLGSFAGRWVCVPHHSPIQSLWDLCPFSRRPFQPRHSSSLRPTRRRSMTAKSRTTSASTKRCCPRS